MPFFIFTLSNSIVPEPDGMGVRMRARGPVVRVRVRGPGVRVRVRGFGVGVVESRVRQEPLIPWPLSRQLLVGNDS